MITVNTQSVASVLRQLAAVAAIVVGLLQAVPMPPAVHPILVAAGAIILAIEHYVADPSTGTPATPPAPLVPQYPASPPQKVGQ